MLLSLYVKNLALIRETELTFGPGLNILSGETGAGKSILLESILLCLGIRSDRELIRRGAESAYVELTFSADDPETVRKLRELEIEPEDGEYRFSRKLTDRKSIARINGETVSLTVMKDAARELIDLYAQNEQRTLLDEDRYIDLLDEFGREELKEPLEAYRKAFSAYRAKNEEIRKLGSDDEERRRALDFMGYEIEEIGKAGIREGEEESLKASYLRLSNAAAVREGLSEASGLLSDGAGDAVSRGMLTLQNLLKFDPGLASTVSVLKDAESLLQDALEDMKRRLIEASDEGDQLPAIEERLAEIGRLKRKYGGSEAEILKKLDQIRKEKAELSRLDEHKEELLREMAEAKKTLVHRALDLREARKTVAEEFSARLAETLKTLNFSNVEFEVRVEETNRYTLKGADEVSFCFSANLGEPMKPLYKVASGGELSRIMLAVKTITVGKKSGGSRTLIFDEVDTGISGHTASEVGLRLAEISEKDQVILISHLPQIVSLADHHFRIEKTTLDGATVTGAKLLSEEESIDEIARLMSTGEITEANRVNAIEMKNRKKTAK